MVCGDCPGLRTRVRVYASHLRLQCIAPCMVPHLQRHGRTASIRGAPAWCVGPVKACQCHALQHRSFARGSACNMLSFSAHESIQGSNRLSMFCGALLRRPIFNSGDQESMAALEDNEYRPASTPRGMRAGSAPAPATPAYQAVVQHSPRLRRMVSHQGIPLPGMPRTTSLQPRPPSLQDQRTAAELHAHGTSDAYGPPLTGPGVQGLRMGSGGASLSGSRQAAQGSLPGPLSRLVPQRQAGRSARQGSLPGPSNVPPGSRVEVPFDFQQVCAHDASACMAHQMPQVHACYMPALTLPASLQLCMRGPAALL